MGGHVTSIGDAEGVADTVGVITSSGLRRTRIVVNGVLPCRAVLRKVLGAFVTDSISTGDLFSFHHRIGHITVITFADGSSLYKKFGTGIVHSALHLTRCCGGGNIKIIVCPVNHGITRGIAGRN